MSKTANDNNNDALPPGLTWKEIDRQLRTGKVRGVPAGTDLEEFLWQSIPESREEIEARNPGRKFTLAPWGRP
jgi:hypothetical protein